MDDGYTTPEGFWLARPLLLPDVRSFDDVLEYLGEWETFKTGDRRFEGLQPAARVVGGAGGRGNRIGPFCTVRALGDAPRSRSIAVRATDLVVNAVRDRIVTPDDELSFRIIAHADRNRALVLLEHGYIIGSHWLAYIDPATVPAYPFERRDERLEGACEAIREAGMQPFVRRDGATITVRAITGRNAWLQNIYHPALKAIIQPDGHLTRTWTDGTVTEERP